MQMDILCTHPMFGPDSGKGSWQGLNFMFEKVRIGSGANRSKRVNAFLQVHIASGGFRQSSHCFAQGQAYPFMFAQLGLPFVVAMCSEVQLVLQIQQNDMQAAPQSAADIPVHTKVS